MNVFIIWKGKTFKLPLVGEGNFHEPEPGGAPTIDYAFALCLILEMRWRNTGIGCVLRGFFQPAGD